MLGDLLLFGAGVLVGALIGVALVCALVMASDLDDASADRTGGWG